MARTPSIRASDRDREQVVERLRHATAEGRLRTEELEERLEAAYSARTYGELDVLVSDLPAPVPARPGVPAPRPNRAPAWAGLAAVLTLFTLLAIAPMAAVRHGEMSVQGQAGPPPGLFGGHQVRIESGVFAAHAHAQLVTGAVVLGLLTVAALALGFGWMVTRTRR